MDIYENELYKEAYGAILNEGEDISNIDTDNFMKRCEDLYKMNSKEFLEFYERKNGEVNVEQQLWAMILKNNNDK